MSRARSGEVSTVALAPATQAAVPVLAVDGLAVDARTPAGLSRVVEDVSFAISPGETLCLAGESGSGKSVTALAIMRLLPPASLRITSGSIRFGSRDGMRDLARLSPRAMRSVRGGEAAMIFQEPMTSLNPVMSVGAQLMEAIREHGGAEGTSVAARARTMLEAVRLTDPARRLTQYPHELSGGMRQRIMIAMALSCRPRLLIADEPTTALDVTVQAGILDLLRALQRDTGTALLLITHDMGVVAEMGTQVAIMRAGRIVETGTAAAVFGAPRVAYTRELLAAVPRLGARRGTDGPPRITPLPAGPRPASNEHPGPVLFAHNLRVTYGRMSGLLRRADTQPVVDGISFELRRGRTLGLVGESGSGKSTTARAVTGLVPFEGEVTVDGVSIAGLRPSAMRPVRRRIQMIFQDPYASLDPRMNVGEAVAEPLVIHRVGTPAEQRERVAALLERVGLDPSIARRYPHEFSGGQRQRLCIARALALEPAVIVADESVAALDVSVRARVLDLMLELQETLGLSYLFISHDMAVIERMSHDVAVMQGGRIVEAGPRRTVFEAPQVSYTRALMAAVPIPVPASLR